MELKNKKIKIKHKTFNVKPLKIKDLDVSKCNENISQYNIEKEVYVLCDFFGKIYLKNDKYTLLNIITHERI